MVQVKMKAVAETEYIIYIDREKYTDDVLRDYARYWGLDQDFTIGELLEDVAKYVVDLIRDGDSYHDAEGLYIDGGIRVYDYPADTQIFHMEDKINE